MKKFINVGRLYFDPAHVVYLIAEAAQVNIYLTGGHRCWITSEDPCLTANELADMITEVANPPTPPTAIDLDWSASPW